MAGPLKPLIQMTQREFETVIEEGLKEFNTRMTQATKEVSPDERYLLAGRIFDPIDLATRHDPEE